MAIVKMKRLRVIALAAQRDELLQRLLHAGCVEVTEPQAELSDPEWMALLKRDTSALSDVKARQNAVNGALEALQKYAPEKKGLFIHRRSIKEKEFLSDAAMNAALHSAGEINARVQKISQLYTQENRLTGQRASLVPWSGLDLPLNTGGTEHARISFHTCPPAVDLEEVRQALAQAAPSAELFPVSADRELQYLVIMCHRAESETVTETVRPWSFSTVSFKDMNGTAAENITRIDGELEEIRVRRDKTAEEIAAMADCRRDLQVCSDRLTAELSKESAKERLLTNGTVVFMEGWISEPGIPKAEAEMLKFACAWETAEPLEEEEPPILLHNPKWMTPINMVTEMYSLPAYRGIDPNPLIFWFFLFFFGFMFADVAYGIIIWAVCFVISRKYNPKGTMGYMFRLGQYMGISTLICGIFTGGFFGDVIPKVAEQMFGIPMEGLPQWLQTFSNGIIVNPINDPMTTLILAIVIGVVQLVFGQCIHIYMGFRDGHPIDGLLDVVPWWLFFGSIGLVVDSGGLRDSDRHPGPHQAWLLRQAVRRRGQPVRRDQLAVRRAELLPTDGPHAGHLGYRQRYEHLGYPGRPERGRHHSVRAGVHHRPRVQRGRQYHRHLCPRGPTPVPGVLRQVLRGGRPGLPAHDLQHKICGYH